MRENTGVNNERSLVLLWERTLASTVKGYYYCYEREHWRQQWKAITTVMRENIGVNSERLLLLLWERTLASTVKGYYYCYEREHWRQQWKAITTVMRENTGVNSESSLLLLIWSALSLCRDLQSDMKIKSIAVFQDWIIDICAIKFFVVR